MNRWQRTAWGLTALGVAAVIWLPCAHFFFRPDLDAHFRATGIPPRAGPGGGLLTGHGYHHRGDAPVGAGTEDVRVPDELCPGYA